MNDQQAARQKIVFLHIAKTGGSTFRRILSQLYGDAFHTCRDRNIDDIAATLAKYDAIEFHGVTSTTEWFRPFGEIVRLGRWDLLENVQVFTMLRDPVDRYLSNYYYMVSRRAFTEAAMAKHGYKFPESLEEMMTWPASFNFPIEFLLGKPAKAGVPVTRDDLEAVKDMFRRLNVHVGLTERFAESTHIFETITGRHVPGSLILNTNRNPNRPPLTSIPEEIRTAIRERSALEQELYDFGTDLFLADLARSGPIKEFQFEDDPTIRLSASADKPTPSLWSRLMGALRPNSGR